MNGFFDDLVGDVRAVEVAGIDVVDAGFDGFAQNGDGGRAILRRAKDMRAGELHGAVAHAVDGHIGAGEGEGSTEIVRGHFFSCALLLVFR